MLMCKRKKCLLNTILKHIPNICSHALSLIVYPFIHTQSAPAADQSFDYRVLRLRENISQCYACIKGSLKRHVMMDLFSAETGDKLLFFPRRIDLKFLFFPQHGVEQNKSVCAFSKLRPC